MHIILDANIYAADYRMNGVAFQSLFDYMRRTESQLVLSRATREEVVVGYGRQLKRETKVFEEAWKQYHRLDLSGVAHFTKPDIRRAMVDLRRKLMKPTAAITPIYIPEITGNFVQEVFMRGIHRTRPANDCGEELRDVILWLWVIDYTNTVDAATFISSDRGFWDADRIHPHIDRDLRVTKGRLFIHRTILDFLKSHAPAQADVTPLWFQKHFEIQRIELELIDSAVRQLTRALSRGTVQLASVEKYEIKAGRVYEVSADSQFAEIQLHLVFKFLVIPGTSASYLQNLNLLDAMKRAFEQSELPAVAVDPPPLREAPSVFRRGSPIEDPSARPRDLRCDATARVSVRVKGDQTTEISVDGLDIDRGKLFTDFYRSVEQSVEQE
jgi:hypothetical protein